MENKANLYQLTQEIESLAELIAMDSGEISESSEQLERKLGHLLATKTEGCVSFVEREKDLIKLADEKIKQLQDFKKKKKNSIERFQAYVSTCLEKTDRESFESDLYKIKFRKPSKVLTIKDENTVPVEFITVETITKVDKVRLKKAIKDGLQVDGIRLEDGKKSLIMSLK